MSLTLKTLKAPALSGSWLPYQVANHCNTGKCFKTNKQKTLIFLLLLQLASNHIQGTVGSLKGNIKPEKLDEKCASLKHFNRPSLHNIL